MELTLSCAIGVRPAKARGGRALRYLLKSPPGFAHIIASASRPVGPGTSDLWNAEERSVRGGARSALRNLTHRGCPNGGRAAHAVSSATRPLAEHRSGVGACHRPPQCEPTPGTACSDARPQDIHAPAKDYDFRPTEAKRPLKYRATPYLRIDT